MLRLIFFIVLITMQIFSRPQENSKVSTLNFNNLPLRSVLNEISSKTGFSFIYKDNLVDKLNITIHSESSNSENAVKDLLDRYGIAYEKFDENYFVLYKRYGTKEKKSIYKATLIEQPAPDMDPAVPISKPKMISNINPVYPEDAVKNDIEGNVRLKLLVTKEGDVAITLIEKSSGSSILDSAAVNHIKNVKFLPAEENGKPKKTWISIIFKYHITDGPLPRMNKK